MALPHAACCVTPELRGLRGKSAREMGQLFVMLETGSTRNRLSSECGFDDTWGLVAIISVG